MSPESLQTDLPIRAEINLYYDLFVPDDVGPAAPLLIAVHGYGAHKRYMMREAKLVAPAGCVIASLQAPHPHYRQTPDGYRVGFGWLSDHKPEEHILVHHKFILDVIDELSGKSLIDRRRVYMYGFSQACALNLKFAFTYPDVMRGIVGVCGGIPGDLATNELYKPFDGEMFYLYGDDDEFYTQEQFAEYDRKLAERLPHYRSKHYNAKHEITQEMRVDIREFLAAEIGK